MSIAILPMSAENNWNPATVGLIQSSFFWGYLLTQVTLTCFPPPLIIIIIIIMYLLINNFISHFFVLIDRLLVAFGRTQWAGRRFWDLVSFGGPLLRFLHLLLLKLDCPSYSLFALSWGLVR